MPGTFTVVRPPETSTSDSTTTLRSTRPTWRRWLIDVERGLMHGVRGDSIFFVYFFLTSATIAASVVLGIALLQWTVVILALTVVLSVEMFNQSVKSLFAALGRPADDKVKAALRIGSAAVFVAIVGSVLTIGLILGKAALQMFRGA
ncbi:MAG TPA: diacylglycerol kinase [Planctomycetaceae bacterium]|jgi:diacylglycerol kinase|nr:diacylglycerol kinase [Planctomycetaceae bacterium]